MRKYTSGDTDTLRAKPATQHGRYRHISPYRDLFIAEMRSEDVRGDGPMYVLDNGVQVHTAYYVIDEFGDCIHPIQAWFASPYIACIAADAYIDTPKMFDAKVTAALRAEKNFLSLILGN